MMSARLCMIIIVIINDVTYVELATNDCFSLGIEVCKIGIEVCKTMFLVIMLIARSHFYLFLYLFISAVARLFLYLAS